MVDHARQSETVLNATAKAVMKEKDVPEKPKKLNLRDCLS